MKCVSGWFKAALLSAGIGVALSACAVYEPAPYYQAPAAYYYPAPYYYEPAPVYSFGFVGRYDGGHRDHGGRHGRGHDWR